MYAISKKLCLSVILLLSLFLMACSGQDGLHNSEAAADILNRIPEFSGEPYIELDDNIPGFSEEEKTTEAFEKYSELDGLGRCGQAYANVCQEIMPTEKRGAINKVHPSGWQSVEYDIVDGGSLYNRCHLIAFQLAGENANEKNLITGTRYMNVEGMLPFENEVAEYVKETDHHVLYRVTPVYDGNDLIAAGVEMEAWSVEDNGAGVAFHIFAYNSQPGITIDYATGESHLTEDGQAAGEETKKDGTRDGQAEEYVLNTNSHKFHLPACDSVEEMNDENKEVYRGSRAELIRQGYSPCTRCNP